MTKRAAFGTAVKLGDGGGPEVFTTVAAVRDITGPSLEVGEVDVTTHDSPSAIREFVMGWIETGEITFEMVWDPSAASQTTVRTWLTGRLKHNVKIVFSDGTEWLIPSYVKSFTPAAPVDGALTSAVTLRPSGMPTLA